MEYHETVEQLHRSPQSTMIPRLQRSLLEGNPRATDGVSDRQSGRILGLTENPPAGGTELDGELPWRGK